MAKDVFWETNSLSSTKKIKKTGIFRFFSLLSKMWRIEERYKADKIGKNVELCPTPTLMLKDGEEKLFQR